jgi:phosphatidylglycerol lysyltransferase
VRKLVRRVGRGISRRVERFEGAGLWILGHASRVWPVVVVALVLWATWDTLRGVHIRQVRAALRAIEPGWIWAAAGLTALNIAAVGFYDVVAFRRTGASARDRWKYGAVAFAWSNFLTLGPVAGPAIRFWLYRSSLAELRPGIIAVATAFIAGLAGWTAAMTVVIQFRLGIYAAPALAAAITAAVVFSARWAWARIETAEAGATGTIRAFHLVAIGWFDWMLAGAAFLACLHAAGAPWDSSGQLRTYFLGQSLGLVSLVPGGLGGADAFWIAHLPIARPVAAASDAVYRLVYYVIPWAMASLLLLSWATRRAQRRVEIARRVLAALTGAAGLLIILSSASPALHARLVVIERVLPLPLVEAGQLTAASAGLLLLMLARGLARGYRAAFQWTMALLSIAAVAAVLKGLDWEEAAVLGTLAAIGGFYAGLFDRESHGDWLQGGDVAVALAGVAVFIVFGTLAHRLEPAALVRWSELGYRLEAIRFVRTAAALALLVGAVALYVGMRVPVRFERPSAADIDAALELHARLGGSSTPLMIANGDKAIFRDDDRGWCAYRTIGPYLVVFADPIVRSAQDCPAFLDALFTFSAGIDRRPLFYQVSPDWIPPLHDRGYAFFKLGEEAHLPLERVTLEGHGGKMNRQILRRAERDGARFRVMPPVEVTARLAELRAVSDDWLRSKAVSERQFSIGYFDDRYLQHFPCAVVESSADGRVLAFANLLRGPQRGELSIDLMRYRSDGPRVMDFLFVSLFLYGREQGYKRFNLGMAPLASVGQARGAHQRERLANLLFQHGEHWYNFQGLRYYKEKWEPDWQPRYMGYAGAWEWPVAIAYVSALIAGGWGRVLQGERN